MCSQCTCVDIAFNLNHDCSYHCWRNVNEYNLSFKLLSKLLSAFLITITTELSPSKGAYPVDTLMWNAKGFLNRIEKLNEDEGVSGGEKKGDGTTSNERDENVKQYRSFLIRGY